MFERSEFLTVAEVSRILKVHPRTVINMIKLKKIKGLELSGTKRITYRVLRGEIDRYISKEYSK